MKKLFFIPILLSFFACNSKEDDVVEDIPTTKVLAFQGAEGAGSYTKGGRSGRVIYVTNLTDNASNPTEGSLRWALQQGSGITIVFSVSGTIELAGPLNITGTSITIAGQTAPGEGITLKKYTTIITGSDIIIRFIRFRLGDLATEVENNAEDALEGRNGSNIVIDHCSMSWSMDECSSFYDNEKMTMQWCILTESLNNSKHPKGKHGYGGMWGGRGVSFHHNLLAHHKSRTPRFCGARFSNRPDEEKLDFTNNVIYNWAGDGAYGGEGGYYNIVNNYYKPGPATDGGGNIKTRIFSPDSDPSNGGDKSPLWTSLKNQGLNSLWGKFYVVGNYMNESASVTANNWEGIQPKLATELSGKETTSNAKILAVRDAGKTISQIIDEIKLNAPVDITPIKTQSAEEAYRSVLDFAGVNYKNKRDAVDMRVIDNVRNRTYYKSGSKGSQNGLIDSQEDVDSWPNLVSETRNLDEYDTDRDGIPNEWEDAHGLNKNNPADGKAVVAGSHYTNLEVYLNSLVVNTFPEYLRY